MLGRLTLLAAAIGLTGCIQYTLQTVAGYARDVPEQMYGLGPGSCSKEDLRKGGWALSDKKEDSETWVLGQPGEGISDAEAHVKEEANGQRKFLFMRLRYGRATRMVTYRDLVHDLQRLYGKPQTSVEMSKFPLFEFDATIDAPRPNRYVVHKWRGQASDVLLVGGLEDDQNLAESMQYQLLLVPPGTVSVGPDQ